MKVLLFLSLCMFISYPLNSMSLSCNDPDVIFCMPLGDAGGLVARDMSRSGLTGTLNGGPSWVDARASRRDIVNSSSSPIVNMHNHIFFTATVGESITTPATTIFDFSSNKPFMIGVQASLNAGAAGNKHILNHCTNTSGWNVRYNATSNKFTLGYAAVEDLIFNASPGITDKNPHSLFFWRDPIAPNNHRFYLDGEFISEYVASADVASQGSQALQIAETACNNTGEFSGRVSHVQIWKASVPRGNLDAFVKSWHNAFFGDN